MHQCKRDYNKHIKMGWGVLKFLANNARDLEVIPAEVQAWISQEKDMEAAQKAGKWIVLKMLM
jgi:Iap family predicted aminopeptidase